MMSLLLCAETLLYPTVMDPAAWDKRLKYDAEWILEGYIQRLKDLHETTPSASYHYQSRSCVASVRRMMSLLLCAETLLFQALSCRLASTWGL
jgi:hypothetical protein